MARLLWLIGMMGSGKTTAGSELAGRLGVRFVDTADVVATGAGRTLPEILDDGGPASRELEPAAVDSIAAAVVDTVVATGEGVVLNDDNVVRMRSTGTVVWLMASPTTPAERVDEDGVRPLPADAPTAAKPTEILESRIGRYSAASHVGLGTDGVPLGRVVDALEALWPGM